MKKPLPRVGQINFLNVLPLAYGYAHGAAEELAITRGVPAVLNNDILTGRLDIAGVSSILYARHPEKLLVLPHLCVGSFGPVESILLVSKKPIDEIEDDRIALTAKSATSHALLKIILRSGYGAFPDYRVQTLDPDPLTPIPEDATAALYIGDDALHLYHHASLSLYLYDLGSEWRRLTGRPMVYSLWVTTREFAERSPELLSSAYARIRAGLNFGRAHIGEAIHTVLGEKPFAEDELREYLSGSVITWDLDEKYIGGLKTFYQLAEKAGLIEKAPEIAFAPVEE